MDVKIILVVSVALQYLAAAFALRLVRTSAARFGWLAIFVAIALMATRRTITLYRTFEGTVTPDPAAESVALLISIMMLMGVATIRPLFNAVAKSEHALREEKSRAQTYLDVVGVMIIALDRDNRITLANRKACEILGYGEQELIGQDWFTKCLPRPTSDEARACFGSTIPNDAASAEYFENPVRTRSGETRLITWHNTLLHDAEGNVVGALNSGQDITERKEASNQLREAGVRMDAVFTNIADGIVLIDEKGVVERINRAAEKLFGYGADEIVGKDVRVLMPKPYRDEHDEYIATYVRTGIPRIIGTRREVVGRRKDGATFPLELHVSEIYLGDRRIFCGVVTNITARKEAEEIIAAHNAELAHVARVNTMGEMASGLAHEISQPLTAIVNYTSATLRKLREGGAVTPEIIDSLDRASSQARRAGEIIHRLHSFVHKREPRQDPLNLAETISDVIRLLAAELRRAQVEIEQDIEVDLPTVMGDSIQIQQVVLNLIKNGIEAMAATPANDRRIRVSAAKIDDNLTRVTVSDCGSGLKEGDHQKIFDQFHTTKTDGMGMGLSISRSIIELHGGRLTAQNNRDGGATFSFTIPTGKEEITP